MSTIPPLLTVYIQSKLIISAQERTDFGRSDKTECDGERAPYRLRRATVATSVTTPETYGSGRNSPYAKQIG